ncbi:MAG TPA: ATP-binding cassette domain-containing protein [Streptosporangiaceae bacterium]
MGIEVAVTGLTKSFGPQTIWRDVSLTFPRGEISVMLGPSGTGKTVFLKTLMGLLKADSGSCLINGVDTVSCSERKLYETRRLLGVMFQDGALFGSMSLYDNIAFPLREHTKKPEKEIRRIVLDRMAQVGLSGSEAKLPGEVSGGMRKRGGLARALVLDPEIILCDEPDSGQDPVRTSYMSQDLIDLNARTDATILIVTHNLDIAQRVPDNLGMLFRGGLVGFGPREVMLTSDNPAVRQFLSAQRVGPIGMFEEKDDETITRERAQLGHEDDVLEPLEVPPQLEPSPGLPPRQALGRRAERLARMMPRLSARAREAIEANFGPVDVHGPAHTQDFPPVPEIGHGDEGRP